MTPHSASDSRTLSYRNLHGREIEAVLPVLARLRIDVFREFPYLYDGDLAYEEAYLRSYIDAAECLVVLLEDDEGDVVGATTGLPMTLADPAFRVPFEKAGHDLDGIFYFGESIILPAHRGQGAGGCFLIVASNTLGTMDMRSPHSVRSIVLSTIHAAHMLIGLLIPFGPGVATSGILNFAAN